MTNPSVFIELFKIAAPIVMDIVRRHQAANNGQLPTDAQVQTVFEANIDRYLAEGEAWKATHPDNT
jgi:hypothetical protein